MSERFDEMGNILPDAERLTAFGKFLRSTSLDELPQLINVLRGDMSLVGPRPFVTKYMDLYNERQTRRHELKPGITGWAQINGRNALSWKEKFEMDVWYVENVSLRLDLKILWITFYKVMKKEGINAAGSTTGVPFSGNQL
jgi:lipopolysaccharide/colanic/teichoic acid biosynthesis glycosyltransferase